MGKAIEFDYKRNCNLYISYLRALLARKELYKIQDVCDEFEISRARLYKIIPNIEKRFGINGEYEVTREKIEELKTHFKEYNKLK